MPSLLLALTLATTDPADSTARRHDPWLAPDKVKHGVLAFAVESGSYASLRLTADHRSAIAGAAAVTAGLSLLKEYRDRNRTGFSVRDLVWDAAGITAAMLILSHQPQR